MTTEQELKQGCTPEIIKIMVELAEGFECDDDIIIANKAESIFFEGICNDVILFPLLIHRAVEGFNKLHRKKLTDFQELASGLYCVKHIGLEIDTIEYRFEDYKPQSLTQLECALLHCLIYIFEEA